MKEPEIDERRTVVIDTNCLLQILGRHGKYRPIWNAFLQERFVWCISNEIVSEILIIDSDLSDKMRTTINLLTVPLYQELII